MANKRTQHTRVCYSLHDEHAPVTKLYAFFDCSFFNSRACVVWQEIVLAGGGIEGGRIGVTTRRRRSR
jgi:hypothetical protein